MVCLGHTSPSGGIGLGFWYFPRSLSAKLSLRPLSRRRLNLPPGLQVHLSHQQRGQGPMHPS